MPAAAIKPEHKAIRHYYERLRELADQQVGHESAVRSAFQVLLTDVAREHGWTLIPELSARAAGATIRPDATLRDKDSLPRGYWEAKDTQDDLDAEIARKKDRGYPLNNTIFEDTRRAVLFQDGREAGRFDLTDPAALADLLGAFLGYTEPAIAEFETAVAEFKGRVPDLARGLAGKVAEAHGDNPRFQAAFADFFALCQSALNPNIRREAVDEMLVQHLLTERLIRTIFDNPDFIHQNVIAAEVETVVAALVSKSFSRADFLRGLDRFYVAIENAARTLREFADKPFFLNTVYERPSGPSRRRAGSGRGGTWSTSRSSRTRWSGRSPRGSRCRTGSRTRCG